MQYNPKSQKHDQTQKVSTSIKILDIYCLLLLLSRRKIQISKNNVKARILRTMHGCISKISTMEKEVHVHKNVLQKSIR